MRDFNDFLLPLFPHQLNLRWYGLNFLSLHTLKIRLWWCVYVNACVRGCGGACTSPPILALIPGLARSLCSYLTQLLCTSPHDWYANILPSRSFPAPMQEHFCHWVFPLPKRSVIVSSDHSWTFSMLSSIKAASWFWLHLQSNHISFHPKVTLYSLVSPFHLDSCINLV